MFSNHVIRKIFLAVVLMALVFAACGGGGPLVGKWYSSQIVADNDPDGNYYSYWFKSNGTGLFNAGMMEFKYTATANTITISNTYTQSTGTYTLSGNVLTLTPDPEDGMMSVIREGTYYKKTK